MSEMIDDALIDYVAELSRLKLIGEEREAAKRDLNNVLAQVEVLGEVDVAGVEPITHPQPIVNAMRPDAVQESYSRERILENAPDAAQDSFRVPRTVE
jgi:aspartyl-tRNA(Asn)/glutamyl-tRNA(Gln) amidotransferase subunit C